MHPVAHSECHSYFSSSLLHGYQDLAASMVEVGLRHAERGAITAEPDVLVYEGPSLFEILNCK